MAKIQDPKLLQIIEKLYAHNNAEIISAHDREDAVLRGWNPGVLAKFSVNDPNVKALMDSIVTEWEHLNRSDISHSSFVVRLNKMADDIDALAAYHPDYDQKTKKI